MRLDVRLDAEDHQTIDLHSQRSVFEIAQCANEQVQRQPAALRTAPSAEAQSILPRRDFRASDIRGRGRCLERQRRSSRERNAQRRQAKQNAASASTPSVNSSTVRSGARLDSICAHLPRSLCRHLGKAPRQRASRRQPGARSPSAVAETVRRARHPAPAARENSR